MVKRHLENEIARISKNSGYSEGFLMGVCYEYLEDGEVLDLKMIEDIAMEQDY